MIGPPGSGKTMLAKRLPSILAPLRFEEALETTKIHSVAGVLDSENGAGEVQAVPFAAPHHLRRRIDRRRDDSAAGRGLARAQRTAVPRRAAGVSAQRARGARQPLEDGTVTISRAAMSLRFPARFMLAAAMNPCPCGYFNDKSRDCMCTPPMIQRYVSKVSGPLLDRIDIHLEVPAVQYKELRGGAAAEGSAEIRARVLAAREKQHARFNAEGTRTKGTANGASRQIYSNSQMSTQQIRTYCELSTDAERLLERAMQQQGLSARAHDRILKVARTIADLGGEPNIAVKHIAEAIQYRTLDRSYWS